MAEFCLDCLNKINGTNDSAYRYVLSWQKEICEECGEIKRVVVVERRWSYIQRLLAEASENYKNRK